MNQSDSVYLLIEQNLQSFADEGVCRKTGDVEACLRYRDSLTPADQRVYDDLLRGGTFAGSAAELAEVLSEREKPQEEQRTRVAVGVS